MKPLLFYTLLLFYVDLRKEKSDSCMVDFEQTEIDLAVQKLEPLQLQSAGGPGSSLSSYNAVSASLGAAVDERLGPTSISSAPRSGTRRPERPLPAPPVGDEASCSDGAAPPCSARRRRGELLRRLFPCGCWRLHFFVFSPLHCAHNANMVLPLKIATPVINDGE
jgi:hypothetical protein